jgi:DNA-binding Xre family transcriptional regulator
MKGYITISPQLYHTSTNYYDLHVPLDGSRSLVVFGWHISANRASNIFIKEFSTVGYTRYLKNIEKNSIAVCVPNEIVKKIIDLRALKRSYLDREKWKRSSISLRYKSAIGRHFSEKISEIVNPIISEYLKKIKYDTFSKYLETLPLEHEFSFRSKCTDAELEQFEQSEMESRKLEEELEEVGISSSDFREFQKKCVLELNFIKQICKEKAIKIGDLFEHYDEKIKVNFLQVDTNGVTIRLNNHTLFHLYHEGVYHSLCYSYIPSLLFHEYANRIFSFLRKIKKEAKSYEPQDIKSKMEKILKTDTDVARISKRIMASAYLKKGEKVRLLNFLPDFSEYTESELMKILPKLNLGVIKYPEVKNLSLEFLEAEIFEIAAGLTPFIPEGELTKICSQKLSEFYMRFGGFQTSKERALEVVTSLNKKISKPYQKT